MKNFLTSIYLLTEELQKKYIVALKPFSFLEVDEKYNAINNEKIDKIIDILFKKSLISKLNKQKIMNAIKLSCVINYRNVPNVSDLFILYFVKISNSKKRLWISELNNFLDEVLFKKINNYINEYVEMKVNLEEQLTSRKLTNNEITYIKKILLWIEEKVIFFKNTDNYFSENKNYFENILFENELKEWVIKNINSKLSILDFHKRAFNIMLNKTMRIK
ncbi:hypothetical protein [Spiroplasma endosymbiont of Labia minor]|uniref:hypothetical protein n=1 Tax=Spiroplasma endosymbiont of Labia minor TaxID=3066305 RepID=UPI0030D3E4C3